MRARPVRSLFAGVATAVLSGLIAAPPASSHAIVTRDGGVLAFRATDFVSRNDVSVRLVGETISIADATGVGGVDPGGCRAGRVDPGTGFVVEALCSRAGVTQVRVNVGEREDDVVADLPLPVRVIGGGGMDQIRTGPTADFVDGGEGDDLIDGGGGEDAISGGPGDDVVAAQDGAADVVVCGPGLDAVAAYDPVDRLAGDCEPGAPRPRADATAPVTRTSAARRQPALRRVTVRASADEAVRLVAQASMVVRAKDFPLRPGRATVAAPAGEAVLTPALSAREVRIARRAIRRGHRVRVFVTVVATDAAGNSSVRRVRTLTLR